MAVFFRALEEQEGMITGKGKNKLTQANKEGKGNGETDFGSLQSLSVALASVPRRSHVWVKVHALQKVCSLLCVFMRLSTVSVSISVSN